MLPPAPGPKRIEVSIPEQRIRAYEGETLVLETFISTGLPPNDTETGRFRIRYKVLIEDMRGATDAEGNVVWVVGDGGKEPPGSIPYGVADVPNVMYVNLDAEALHGAYWHNNFGQRMSHGCINLPLPVSEFLYGWALGTPVTVCSSDSEGVATLTQGAQGAGRLPLRGEGGERDLKCSLLTSGRASPEQEPSRNPPSRRRLPLHPLGSKPMSVPGRESSLGARRPVQALEAAGQGGTAIRPAQLKRHRALAPICAG